MLGAGQTPPKSLLNIRDEEPEWTTLDIDPGCDPDLKFDLDRLSELGRLPVPNESFDEIHCYEALHMFGQQGNFRGFFNEFNAFWKALKPG